MKKHRRIAWQEAESNLQPWPDVPFIYEYPQMGLHDYTHVNTHTLTSQLPLAYLCPTTDHWLASIYGTLVIFYIYPARLLLSRLIIILCDDVCSPWRLLLLKPLRVVFGDCLGDQGDEYDKNNNPLLTHAAEAQQLAAAICSVCVFMQDLCRPEAQTAVTVPLCTSTAGSRSGELQWLMASSLPPPWLWPCTAS